MTVAAPLITGTTSDAELNERLLGSVWRAWPKPWRLAFAVSGAGTLLLDAGDSIGTTGNRIDTAVPTLDQATPPVTPVSPATTDLSTPPPAVNPDGTVNAPSISSQQTSSSVAP